MSKNATSDRPDGRGDTELRPTEMIIGFQTHAEGSVLIKNGNTWVLCAASVEEEVPPFMRGESRGWITADYAMLPRSTHTRTRRDPGGRGKEIKRLIGRSLRAAVNLEALGERTIHIDCDVLQADGGTRTASITGGYLALALAVQKIAKDNASLDPKTILRGPVAAISVGIVDGAPRLDLNYIEDSNADVDMNIVMNAEGALIEVQGTAEHNPFSKEQLGQLIDLASKGIAELCELQRKYLD